METAVTRPPRRGRQGTQQHKVKDCPQDVMQLGGRVGLPVGLGMCLLDG